jgi:hypothetical protein
VADSLNDDLKSICAWAEKWLVTYNHTKTEQVTYSRKRDMAHYHKVNGLNKNGSFNPGPVTCPHPTLSFSGAVVPQSPQVKIVGLTISYNLTWGTHIMNIHRNANRSLAMLRRARRVLSPPALSTIYKSYIRSQVEYCCPIWMGAANTFIKSLDRIQVRAIRILGDVEGNKLQSLAHRRGVAAMSVFHRLIFRQAPSPLHSLIPQELKIQRVSRRSRFPPVFKIPRISASPPEYWTRSCIPLASHVWNTAIPPSLREIENKQKFKLNVNCGDDLGIAFMKPFRS